MNPGLAAQIACILEATARKPGNVHRFCDHDDTGYIDFLTSAAAIAPVLADASNRSIGATVLEAVQRTRQVARANTNLGIILLLTSSVFSNMADTMRDPTARFYAVEHPTIMIVAIALAHIGRVVARKAKTPGDARMRTVVFFALSVVLLLVGTPWPGTHDNRPLFRI